MQCPDCGLNVLVVEGAISAHQAPQTLQPCDGSVKAEPTPTQERPEPAKKATAKTSKTMAAKPARKH